MTTPNDERLEPCPHCGGNVFFEPDDKIPKGQYMIFCDTLGCNCKMEGMYGSREEITRIWNTRTPPKPHGDEGKALEAFEEVVSIFMDEKSDQSTLYERLGVAFARRIIGDRHSHTIRAALSSPPTASEATGKVDIGSYKTGRWFKAKSIDEMEAFFWSRLPAIRSAARELGYAIGVHGSARRDFDLIATPWREGAATKDELAWAIEDAVCGLGRSQGRIPYEWEDKPLGRVATAFPACWTADIPDCPKLSAGHIDLSVVCAQPPAQSWEWIEGMKRENTCKCGLVRCTENYAVEQWNAALDAVKAEAEKRKC